jgi:hypothetical protein
MSPYNETLAIVFKETDIVLHMLGMSVSSRAKCMEAIEYFNFIMGLPSLMDSAPESLIREYIRFKKGLV